MKVIEIGLPFIGEKEKPNNGGFYNEELQKMMTEAGHRKGEAWCCYLMEALFVKAYPERESVFRLFFSGSCVQTFRNMRDGVKTKNGLVKSPFTISQKPVVGALVLWQKYKDGQPTGLGHAALCYEATTETIFRTLEGNTNRDGSREGTMILPKVRSTAWQQNGLNVMGFVIINDDESK